MKKNCKKKRKKKKNSKTKKPYKNCFTAYFIPKHILCHSMLCLWFCLTLPLPFSSVYSTHVFSTSLVVIEGGCETKLFLSSSPASVTVTDTSGRYHGGRRPSNDDSFHGPTVIPPSALDKLSIMKRYHHQRTCSHTSPCRSPVRVMLHDTRFVECQCGMTVGLWKLSSLDGRRPPWYLPRTDRPQDCWSENTYTRTDATQPDSTDTSAVFPAISLGSTIFGWDFCVCDRFLIQP